MHKIISIEDLEAAKNKTLHCEFEEKIDGVDCVTPIHADLTVKSLGDFIEVKGNVKGIVKLECDLCLKNFDYKLDFEIDELYAKNALLGDIQDSGQEFEIKEGQFVTDLNGSDEIDIYDLLYQSVILALPNKKVCGINCNEGFFETDETYKIPDARMEVFKNIKVDRK